MRHRSGACMPCAPLCALLCTAPDRVVDALAGILSQASVQSPPVSALSERSTGG
jgi:hypothetical protein